MRRALVGSLAVLVLLTACTSSGGGTKRSAGSSASAPPSTSVSGPTTLAPSRSSSSASKSPQARTAPPLSAFRVADVTFVGTQAWALGTATCLSGRGRCSAIEHSVDGGRSWQSLPAPAGATVVFAGTTSSCAKSCVRAIRFASAKVGYVFGAAPSTTSASASLYLTTDGGHSWRPRTGGADALESLDGNVIRVVSLTAGCPPGCTYRAQTSGIGSMSWHAVTLPGTPSQGDGATLARTGNHAYLLTTGNPAGGANNARSVLYTSGRDGARWANRGEPCPQSGRVEVDAAALTSASDGSVSVLCRERGGQDRTFTATSTQHGRSFGAGARDGLGAAPVSAFAAATSKVIVISSDATYRSSDGGRRFARVGANAGSAPGQLAWLGFASASLGHGISTDHRSIWTTADGGRTWSRHRFA